MPLAVPCSLTAISLLGGWLAPSAASAASAASGAVVVRPGGPVSAGQAAFARTASATTADVAATAQGMRGGVTGVVQAPDGTGLARVCVLASGQAGSASGITRSGGRYLITGLRPGTYVIGYQDCGTSGNYLDQFYGGSMLADAAGRVPVATGQPTWLRPVTMVPAAGGTLAAARVAARRTAAVTRNAAAAGSSVSGVVRNSSGRKLAGICVSAFRATATSVEGITTLTVSGGSYRIPLHRGSWEVSFANSCGGKYAPQWWKDAGSSAKATLLHVRRRSRHFTGIDAKLVIGGVITGTVRAGRPSGPGLGGVCVFAIGRGRATGVFQRAVSHKDGTYRISGLGTGTYRVQFVPQCGAKGNYLGRSHDGLVAVTNG
jgi:hypothetical protein